MSREENAPRRAVQPMRHILFRRRGYSPESWAWQEAGFPLFTGMAGALGRWCGGVGWWGSECSHACLPAASPARRIELRAACLPEVYEYGNACQAKMLHARFPVCYVCAMPATASAAREDAPYAMRRRRPGDMPGALREAGGGPEAADSVMPSSPPPARALPSSSSSQAAERKQNMLPREETGGKMCCMLSL